jgi:molybdopterin converting factor small subunit
MFVTIVCFGAMREYLPESADGNRARIEISDDASLGDLVDTMGAPRRLVHSALVDGERTELSRPLHEGAEVTLMPPFAGGAHR